MENESNRGKPAKLGDSIIKYWWCLMPFMFMNPIYVVFGTQTPNETYRTFHLVALGVTLLLGLSPWLLRRATFLYALFAAVFWWVSYWFVYPLVFFIHKDWDIMF